MMLALPRHGAYAGLALAVALLVAVAGCDGGTGAPDPDTSATRGPAGGPTAASPTGPTSSPTSPGPASATAVETLRPGEPEVIVTGLEVPWGIAFLPDGTALISERDTALLKRVRADRGVAVVGEVPIAVPAGEGGLLGLALSPSFADDRLLYAYVTTDEDNRVVTMPVETTEEGRLRIGEPEPIVTGIPKAAVHNGGRIAFGPDGMLYIGTGDSSVESNAQDSDSLGGKILRVTPDGEVPEDNPFDDSPVWTLGHRNVQGLDWDAAGRMYATEFGQNRFDEVNLVVAGDNYGWPLVEGLGEGDEFHDPLLVWNPDEASPSGAAVVGGALYAAALAGERLWRVPLDGAAGGVGEPRALLVGEFGRLRQVAVAPDGSLWILTSNRDGRGDPVPADDRIIRVPLVGG